MNKLKDVVSVYLVVPIMSEGNPGAANAILRIFTPEAKSIDPEWSLGGLGYAKYLDDLGIYGSDIYVLYSDLCNKELNKMLAVIRASQLGIIDPSLLKDACSRQDYSGRELIDVEDLYRKVKERLPGFDVNSQP